MTWTVATRQFIRLSAIKRHEKISRYPLRTSRLHFKAGVSFG